MNCAARAVDRQGTQYLDVGRVKTDLLMRLAQRGAGQVWICRRPACRPERRSDPSDWTGARCAGSASTMGSSRATMAISTDAGVGMRSEKRGSSADTPAPSSRGASNRCCRACASRAAGATAGRCVSTADDRHGARIETRQAGQGRKGTLQGHARYLQKRKNRLARMLEAVCYGG